MSNKMVSLAERMLELAPLLSSQFQQTELGGRQAPHTPQEKERVRRAPEKASGIEKIEPSADRAIDRLVSPTGTSYELYGLTEDEVRIVEGKE